MMRPATLALLALSLLSACETFFLSSIRTELAPINVSGTEYRIFLVEEEIPETTVSAAAPSDLQLPPAQRPRAVYAEVGGGQQVYCGMTPAGCEAAIRRHNATQRGGGMY